MTIAKTEGTEASDFAADPDLPLPPGPRIGDEIEIKRENVRGWLAGGLILLLVGLDAVLVILAALKVRPFDRDLLALLLTGLLNPVIALVATVLGFYFGEKAGK